MLKLPPYMRQMIESRDQHWASRIIVLDSDRETVLAVIASDLLSWDLEINQDQKARRSLRFELDNSLDKWTPNLQALRTSQFWVDKWVRLEVIAHPRLKDATDVALRVRPVVAVTETQQDWQRGTLTNVKATPNGLQLDL